MAPRALSPNDIQAGLASVSSIAQEIQPPQTLALNAALQTTLQLDELLNIFLEEAQPIVPFDGVIFRQADDEIDVSVGIPAAHRCNYDINLLGEALGELTVTRGRRFGEQELATIEHLLCSLVYPLRNAVHYWRALNAAFHDPLTGLLNRAAFDSTLEREVSLSHRHQHPLALLAIDIDHFKRVNDSYGHSVGDCVLRAVAQGVRGGLRESDLLFRYGGEEFVILLSNTHGDGALEVAERIRARVEKHVMECGAEQLGITISLGLACLRDKESGRDLFDRADTALYRAKKSGRNTVISSSC